MLGGGEPMLRVEDLAGGESASRIDYGSVFYWLVMYSLSYWLRGWAVSHCLKDL